MRHLLFALSLALACGACAVPAAAQTAEQRQELAELKKELGKITTLIRQKDWDGAQAILTAAEAKIDELATAYGVDKTDRKLGVWTLYEDKIEALEIARARAEGRPPQLGPSFSKEIASIIDARCVRCHGGANPRARLDLSTFAGWKRGGQSGRLLTPGNPNASLLMARLAGGTQQRQQMPQGGPPLSADELRVVAKWIAEGARYDGGKDDIVMADLANPPKQDDPSILIPKPKGTETVSFTKDIAPFVSNLCVRCHNENRQSGGLSLVNFYEMMRGGDSGRVVLPGNVEGSRLFRLVGGLENPRMPNDNQVRITRQNYDDLKKWFEEGNAFDGDDPKTPLRTYAMAATQTTAQEFASMTVEQFNELRTKKTEEAWKKALPNDEYRFVQGNDFLVVGNAPAARLEEVHGWAQEHLTNLKKQFPGGSGQAWKGRLAVFVTKDRFGYDEFNQVINNRRAPREMTGHSVITADYADAYVVLQDVGDEASHEGGGLKVNLIDHVTGAYLSREGARVPEWALRGTGLAMASGASPNNAWLKDLDTTAADAVRTVLNPADVFADGTFSPDTLGPVGFALVKYMIQAGGSAKYGSFIKALRDGQSADQAIRAVYNSDLAALGRAFLAELGKGKR
jgi:hypothetical protein